MRVVILTSASNKSGGARQAMYLAGGLAAAGVDVRAFAPADSELLAEGLWPGLIPLPARRSGWREAVEAAMNPQGPTVVHAFHNRGVKLAAVWGLRWRLLGRPAVVLGNRGVCHRPGNLLYYWSPGIDCFTVNSGACARVLRGVGVAARRIRLIYNGVPAGRVLRTRTAAEVRAELGAGADELLFGTVGNDNPDKGFEPLLHAVAATSRGRMVLLGGRPETWEPLAQRLGVSRRVAFVPWTERVADYLQALDVFVLPYRGRQDSLPNTLLEALLMGLPVVATRVGGVAEVLEGRALLVAPDDAKALAGAMERAAADPELRRTMAAASREAAGLFTVERKVAETLALYRELLARRGLEEGGA